MPREAFLVLGGTTFLYSLVIKMNSVEGILRCHGEYCAFTLEKYGGLIMMPVCINGIIRRKRMKVVQ